MSSKTFTRSFAGGEIAPLLFGRLDLTKFQTGLQKCLNFIVTPQGPLHSRPGFEYVIKTKEAGAALIPFSYSSEQTFALEFGDEYVRFHTQGGTLLRTPLVITGVTSGSPGVVTYTGTDPTEGDWVYLDDIEGMEALNGRYAVATGVNAGANTFQLFDLFGAAIDTTGMAYVSDGTASQVYEIASPYTADDVFDLHYVQSADVLTIVHQDYTVRELRRLSATSWTLTAPSFVPTIGTPAAPTGGGTGATGTPSNHVYVTTAIASGTLEESLISASVTVARDLTVVGQYNTVTPAAVTGAVRYNVYKQATGGIYGFIGQTDGAAFRDTNITPDTAITPPLPYAPFASESPRAVSYFGQRRVFGGGGVNPQTLQFTRAGTESNMTYSIPSQDDDAIVARIVSREAHTVRHLVPLDDLLALTSGGVWRLSPPNDDALTPSTLNPRIHSSVGASNVQPSITSDSVLYAQNRGSHIREISYKWETQRYKSDDISVLAPHLFDGYAVVQMAYSLTPFQAWWGVRDDGVLLGLTHQPEHEVKAWHQHNTRGAFTSVCAIAEGSEDGVYVIVERAINGQTVEYVERMHSRRFDALEDAFCVDSGLTYTGTATDTITGLWHLEGAEVVALADGGVEPAQTVENGAITLQAAASTVHVGLAYDCDAQTVPLTMEAAAFGQGVGKNVNEVALRVHHSSGIEAGPTFEKLRPYLQRSVITPYGSPPEMFTGTAKLKIDPQWQDDGTVCVRQSDPLPLTLLAMTLEVSSGG